MHCHSLKDSEDWLDKGPARVLQANQPETAECTVGASSLSPSPLKVSGLLTLFSKFYFNFPSQYLFAIGFTALFSVRSQLPPIVNFTQQSQAVLLSSVQSISHDCTRVRTRLSLSTARFSNPLGSLDNRLLCPPINYNSRTAYSIRDFNCALSVLFTRRY
jgi:hypothetical protein